MKVTIKGDTPMERLTNFAKRIVSVDKTEIDRLDKKWKNRKKPRPRKSTA